MKNDSSASCSRDNQIYHRKRHVHESIKFTKFLFAYKQTSHALGIRLAQLDLDNCFATSLNVIVKYGVH